MRFFMQNAQTGAWTLQVAEKELFRFPQQCLPSLPVKSTTSPSQMGHEGAFPLVITNTCANMFMEDRSHRAFHL